MIEGASSDDYNVKLDRDNQKLYLNNFISSKEINIYLDEFTIVLGGDEVELVVFPN